MKSKLIYSMKLILPVLLITLVFNGCMMMGMGMKRSSINPVVSKSFQNVQTTNKTTMIDQMIEEAVSDLINKVMNINSVAVWEINSQTTGIDVEMIQRKFVTQLVNSTRFKVVTRKKLSKLLNEHNLSLSGTLDEKSSVEIGKIIGVDAFFDGYIIIERNNLLLNLHLLETETGVIVWAITVEKNFEN
jgi:PBP1b-binding outer membrane lipoprotein LpoB